MADSLSSPDAPSAPRFVLAIDAALPAGLREACLDMARALAAQAGERVTVVAGPRARLDEAVDGLRRGGSWEESVPPPPPPAPMSSGPFVWRTDGRPDWAAMWTTFCDLALYGGPPHRGEDAPLRADTAGAWPRPDLLTELRRGIWETTGLYTEPAAPGWLAVTCDTPRMAAWLCAAIILENVDARCEEERLLLPAGPDFELTDQVKGVITVVAKTHHYWQAHVVGPGPAGV